jgi:hypothetical protein
LATCLQKLAIGSQASVDLEDHTIGRKETGRTPNQHFAIDWQKSAPASGHLVQAEPHQDVT